MTDTTAGEGVPADEMIEQIIYEAFGLGSHSDAAEEATRRIKAHLAAQPSAGARGAVAWRCKMAADDEWELCFSDPRCDTSDFAQVQPLYATPAQPDTGDVAALREALMEIADLAAEESAMDNISKGDFERGVRAARLDAGRIALAALSKPNATGAG